MEWGGARNLQRMSADERLTMLIGSTRLGGFPVLNQNQMPWIKRRPARLKSHRAMPVWNKFLRSLVNYLYLFLDETTWDAVFLTTVFLIHAAPAEELIRPIVLVGRTVQTPDHMQ